MKTIRTDLESRLSEVNQEREGLTNRLKQLEALEAALNLLIEDEKLRFQMQQLPLLSVREVNGRKVIGNTLLSRFLVKALSDIKPRALEELVALAKADGINFQKKSPKRVLHFALIGLQRNGYARMVGKSVWQLTEKAILPRELDSQGQREEETAAVPGR